MDFEEAGAFRRFLALLVVGAGYFTLANCAGTPADSVVNSVSTDQAIQPIQKGEGVYHVGKPYIVAGRTYVPALNPNYSAIGFASWYGNRFHGRRTANGEIFDENAISAAHPTLPLPSYVRVTNLDNHKSILVRVNDRGPYAGNRIIDLSRKAAQVLGFYGQGLTKVKIDYLGLAPLGGSDDRTLINSLREGEPAPSPLRTASYAAFSAHRPEATSKTDRVTGETSAGIATAYQRPDAETPTMVVMDARGLY